LKGFRGISAAFIILKEADEITSTFHVAKEMLRCYEERGPTTAHLKISEYSNDKKRSRKSVSRIKKNIPVWHKLGLLY